MSEQPTVVVIGLGYVGLPLAVALARRFPTWGVDIDERRISEIKEGLDRTGEIDVERLGASPLAVTTNAAACPPADFYIVTVPTPVDSDNRPDLMPVMSATRAVAGMLEAERTPIVVYESTVYPGVTEEVCAPELERVSGLTCGRDFFVAYSPERINPGDREHTIDRITKVVAGQNQEVLDKTAELYEAITSGGVFRAASIKTAEAAKVIENAQRDINIAFMNEVAQIFAKIDVSMWDVLEAAGTKWNFLKFQPGLVGGHCIGVDPYYLSFRARELGHDPHVILAGRSINDGMASWTGDAIHSAAGGRTKRTLVLGLTFKEDVPDIRNTKVVDLIARLKHHGHEVAVHDPLANSEEVRHEYGLELDVNAFSRRYDLVVLAVAHRAYLDLGVDAVAGLVDEGGTFADLKNSFPASSLPAHVATSWRL
jgi:UDP-N-acetyl-D-galactosamine dehydrogenase